jgi:hypothetical protein
VTWFPAVVVAQVNDVNQKANEAERHWKVRFEDGSEDVMPESRLFDSERSALLQSEQYLGKRTSKSELLVSTTQTDSLLTKDSGTFFDSERRKGRTRNDSLDMNENDDERPEQGRNNNKDATSATMEEEPMDSEAEEEEEVAEALSDNESDAEQNVDEEDEQLGSADEYDEEDEAALKARRSSRERRTSSVGTDYKEDAMIPCEVCGESSPVYHNSVALCRFCPSAWHIDCLDPPLLKKPYNSWRCPICRPRGTAHTTTTHKLRFDNRALLVNPNSFDQVREETDKRKVTSAPAKSTHNKSKKRTNNNGSTSATLMAIRELTANGNSSKQSFAIGRTTSDERMLIESIKRAEQQQKSTVATTSTTTSDSSSSTTTAPPRKIAQVKIRRPNPLDITVQARPQIVNQNPLVFWNGILCFEGKPIVPLTATTREDQLPFVSR